MNGTHHTDGRSKKERFCKDMVKNGGRGVQRRACLRKACLFLMAIGGDGFTLRALQPAPLRAAPLAMATLGMGAPRAPCR